MKNVMSKIRPYNTVNICIKTQSAVYLPLPSSGTVNAYLALEGEGFMEMRIKHLEKVGEVEKALILNKACANCSLLPSQSTFRQTFVTQLCQMLPGEEAILEVKYTVLLNDCV